MKINPNYFFVLLLSSAILGSCGDDSDSTGNVEPQPTGLSKTYSLAEVNQSGISGTALFEEYDDNSVTVSITLEGTVGGASHPAHIHLNSISETGPVVVTLGTVDGSSGTSTINFSTLDDGTTVTYDELLDFDGYINIHLSADDLTPIAQGNIGSNEGNSGTPTAISFDVSNAGSTAYVISGNGMASTSNPDITLTRGETYEFNVSAPGHPFLIKSVQSTGTGDVYNSGVTNNGTQSGVITFVVPADAPNTLFYNCEFHGLMTGTLNIID